MKNLPDFCATYSDMCRESLEFLHQSFALAHKTAPGGLSIEIGSRKGGSAYMQLLQLVEMYSPDEVPMLFTVDPYGGKPYKGGDVTVPGLYGDVEYTAMKKLLAGFSNHAHWYMESLDFLALLQALRYWWRGMNRRVEGLSHVLLDGDHDAQTIVTEIRAILPYMAKGSAIVVDNVDKDPATVPALQKLYIMRRHESTPGNMIARIEVN